MKIEIIPGKTPLNDYYRVYFLNRYTKVPVPVLVCINVFSTSNGHTIINALTLYIIILKYAAYPTSKKLSNLMMQKICFSFDNIILYKKSCQ